MVVGAFQQDKGYEEDAEEVHEVTTVPEVICLAVAHLGVAGQDQTEGKDHNSLEEGIGEPSPEDTCAEATIFHTEPV